MIIFDLRCALPPVVEQVLYDTYGFVPHHPVVLLCEGRGGNLAMYLPRRAFCCYDVVAEKPEKTEAFNGFGISSSVKSNLLREGVSSKALSRGKVRNLDSHRIRDVNN